MSSTLISVHGAYCKNVQSSPNKDLLAVSQSQSRLVIMDSEGAIISNLELLNESNCTTWYPNQFSQSAVIASASNDRPIVLYNAFDGSEVCKYLTMNHVEMIDAPLAMDFSVDASRLICGGDECLRVFDVQRPVREFECVKLSATKGSKEGLKGRVSSLAVRRDASMITAIGTFNGNLGIYDFSSNQLIFESVGRIGAAQQIAFSPDGWTMFTFSRKMDSILCWDLRCMAIRLQINRPHMQTNQRLHFDNFENMVGFGDSCGNLYIHDQNDGTLLYNDNLCNQGHAASGVTFLSANTVACSLGSRQEMTDASLVVKIKFK